MDSKNREEYINTLNNNKNKILKKEELLTLSLTDETLAKLKKIKKIMEWKTDLALNSIFSFFFNIKKTKEIKKTKLNLDTKQIEIKFTPTVKNEERIKAYLEDNNNNSIIELSIDFYYKKFIGSK